MSFPSTFRLTLQQIRYQLLMFWRTPVALFFTLALPLIMLLLFNALFGDATVTIQGGEWPVRQFYTGGLALDHMGWLALFFAACALTELAVARFGFGRRIRACVLVALCGAAMHQSYQVLVLHHRLAGHAPLIAGYALAWAGLSLCLVWRAGGNDREGRGLRAARWSTAARAPLSPASDSVKGGEIVATTCKRQVTSVSVPVIVVGDTISA